MISWKMMLVRGQGHTKHLDAAGVCLGIHLGPDVGSFAMSMNIANTKLLIAKIK
jgi:hypothetical protein